jgi:hypothetical protein
MREAASVLAQALNVRPNGLPFSRAAAINGRAVKRKPDSKMRSILSTRSGVG